MSILAHAPSSPSSIDTVLVIGEASHYHFYQSLNHQISQHHLQRSSKYRSTTKKIIPSVPRQHSKAPVNSPLSFIRQQKLPHHTTPIPMPTQPSWTDLLPTEGPPPNQRLTPCTGLRNDPTSLPDEPQECPRDLYRQRRPRKVSFDKKVMVICTRFDDDGSKDNDDEATPPAPALTYSYQGQRHSTGDHIITNDGRRRWLTFVTTLKHWKPTMHSHPSIV